MLSNDGGLRDAFYIYNVPEFLLFGENHLISVLTAWEGVGKIIHTLKLFCEIFFEAIFHPFSAKKYL